MTRPAELHSRPLAELRHDLKHQQWQGVSTWSTGVCGHPARGGWFCADCPTAEIARRAPPEATS